MRLVAPYAPAMGGRLHRIAGALGLGRARASNRQLADRAGRASRRRLKGNTDNGIRVDSVFWYGAVDIDPGNLVVWVLLSGVPDDRLPEWFFPVEGQVAGIQGNLDPALRAWLGHLRDTVRAEFSRAGWPNPGSVDVGFDSTHRVEQGGGWSYFR